jgi:hypothetical protein
MSDSFSVSNVSFDNLQVQAAFRKSEILSLACAEIVENTNGVIFLEKSFDEMRADKTGTTGYKVSHGSIAAVGAVIEAVNECTTRGFAERLTERRHALLSTVVRNYGDVFEHHAATSTLEGVESFASRFAKSSRVNLQSNGCANC